MNIIQLEEKLQTLTQNLNKDDFIFDFLLAYELPKANIAKLRKNSDVNTLELNGELIVKNKKLFFKIVDDAKTINFEKILKEQKSMRFVFLTDFKIIKAYDLKLLNSLDITFEELAKNSDFFWPIAGVEKATLYEEKEADVKASVKMAKLYDEIKKSNPTNTKEEIHALNVFLTRLLFCYFAEDTDIFPNSNQFTNYLKNVSCEDGSDLHIHLNTLFDTLNSTNRDISNHLKEFPYVNGGLFKEVFAPLIFTKISRNLIIECGAELNWSLINPDIFGSMIQAVISDEHRGTNGMHYTSVPNIMKVINPLFLDDLKESFENSKGNVKKLNELHKRITNLKIFDPACGSGNFLIIAYKELRKLEMDIFKSGQMLNMPSIKLSQFYGIELDDFAHEVAILSLWLAEHQMNQEFKKLFGDCTPTLPLKDSGNIVCGNATRLDWEEVCHKNEGDEIYILGNPPYLGARLQTKEQKEDMNIVFDGIEGFNNLDYISCWFYKGSDYIEKLNCKFAFVTTNSINQGEQVSMLWSHILKKDIEIFFAYKSFKWTNNAKANAGVIVSIIGIRNKSNEIKYLFENNLKKEVKNINAYLVNSNNIFIKKSTKSISELPEMNFGSMPNDGGYLLLSDEEKNELIVKNPSSEKLIKKFVGSQEFIKGQNKYCLWISDDLKELAHNIPIINERINKCRDIRNSSNREATKKLAIIPHKFAEIRFKNTNAIIMPRVSSERRNYIPTGFLDNTNVISDSALAIFDAKEWLLGVLSSNMHMVWVKAISGYLGTSIRYSATLTYNTFPFPKITQTQKEKIEELVNIILDERDKEYLKTLAELYDPYKMPDSLKKAHENLDLYIESIYRDKPFSSDEERLEHLFKLYEKMIKEENQK
ncbi:N-6 DNA methylase [Arcobacter cryaerophilus gv. pseudocryaerophilus]|uniref:site-specific DNA-methyltransferase (adenine-specific) n=2 Tax=Arcobacteraceae TaxID=2808963 RepID=A0AAU0P0U8_9BACT|nr:DNA methyltransferase [Arcobacter sp. AZ-2023]WPD02295.1 N-6 DNA methylase [Arcobacter sp. DSM 115972]